MCQLYTFYKYTEDELFKDSQKNDSDGGKNASSEV